MKVNDIILAVNLNSLRNKGYYEAVEILRTEQQKGSVQLIVIADGKFAEIIPTNQENRLENSPKQSNSNIFTKNSPQTVKRQQIPAGKPTEITLNRTSGSPLGISILGGVDTKHPIAIFNLSKNGVAEKDGRLKPGDRLLEVNRNDLSQVTHNEAINLLKQAGDRIVFKVLRESSDGMKIHEILDKTNQISTRLYKSQGKNLGLSLRSDSGTPAVFIEKVLPGGEAALDGVLADGDRLVEVDGKDVQACLKFETKN